jgi:tetraether lipid synthase
MKPPRNHVRSLRFGKFLPGQQKPLMAMVEITNRCNMACPVCFTDANQSADDISVTQARHYLEQLLEVTESPIPIQISGGEPTVHDGLPEIISQAKSLGYKNIELVTNGIKIACDDTMLPKLKSAGLSSVYLQFDGLNKENLLKIRGRDLTAVRHGAVAAIRKAGLCCTLAVAVTRGVNDHEIGDIVRFGIENLDVVRAINFQSATPFAGRFEIAGAYDAYSLEEILTLIEAQTGVPADTFLSGHIGHPQCNAMSLVFLVNGKLVPLFKYIRPADLHSFLGKNSRETILDAFAGKKAFFFRHLIHPKAWKLLSKAAPIFGSNPNNVLKSKHILLFAKGFMDKETLDESRVHECCYAITGKHGVISFCAYNNIYRFAGGELPGT